MRINETSPRDVSNSIVPSSNCESLTFSLFSTTSLHCNSNRVKQFYDVSKQKINNKLKEAKLAAHSSLRPEPDDLTCNEEQLERRNVLP